MSTDTPLDRPLDRRFLIRGGAVLAGAAGATALGAALAPTKADAANGDEVVLGQANAATDTTSITIDGPAGGGDAALTLNNASGPSLALQALDEDFDAPLGVGEIANTVLGPQIGVDYGDGPATTFLATGADLLTPFPLSPTRLMDRTLAAGAFIDFNVADTEDVALAGVFLNVTAFAPSATGFLEVYTPGKRPTFPTVRYTRSVSAINNVFVAPGLSGTGERYQVRVYTSQATRILVELTGVVAGYPPAINAGGPGGAAVQRRTTRQAKQRQRLLKSIENR